MNFSQMQENFFKNREDAGRKLANLLSKYRNDKNTIVYGLLRGGVPVAKQVSKILSIPLEPLAVKKIGQPENPEYAIGAITQEDYIVGDQEELSKVDPSWLQTEVQSLEEEIERQTKFYSEQKLPRDPAGQIAIVVDDGVATGYSMLAAIRFLKNRKVDKIVVAVPIMPEEAADLIRKEVDELVVVAIPTLFLGGVGSYYEDFRQVSDDEVVEYLKDPIIFSEPLYDYLADQLIDLPNMTKGRYNFDRFENGEDKINLLYNITGDECIVLGTLMPPDHNLIETFLLSHTIKIAEAKNLALVIPYLSYTRQDVEEPGMSLATDWIAKVAQSSGIDKIITIDIHSSFAADLFKIPLISLSPADLFAKELDESFLKNATIIAPDEGAIHRTKDLNRALKKDLPTAYFEKERHRDDVSSRLVGELTANAIVVDDILDTGVTLISACKKLKDEGVSNIVVMVAHGLFTNPLWEDLWELNVTDIYTTDTIPPKRSIEAKGVSILPIGPLLKNYLQRE